MNEPPNIGLAFRVFLAAILLALGLLLVALGATNVQAAEHQPTITVSPTSGIVGKRISVTGNGFPPSTSLGILFNGVRVGDAFSDDTGSLYASFTVPTRAGGIYRISADGAAAQGFAIIPTVSVSPKSGPPGSKVHITGTGFYREDEVNVMFQGRVVQSLVVSDNGLVANTFTVPVVPSGSQVVSVNGSASGTHRNTFVVTPKIMVDVSKGVPGSMAVVNGTGFAAREQGITVLLGTNTVASQVSADYRGEWSASFQIPVTYGGSHQIRAYGSLTAKNTVDNVLFRVAPSLSLKPTIGQPGSRITVSGVGASAGERISIVVGKDLVEAQATADRLGVWSASITVPVVPRGPVQIRATGTSGHRTEQQLSVVPGVSLASDPAVPPGSMMTVKGRGFEPDQIGISINFDGSTVALANSDGNGSWTATFKVPAAATGKYSITVGGSNTELHLTMAVIPTISLKRHVGSPRELITITGQGFAAQEREIKVTLADTIVASDITAGADGSWSASFIVPALPSGAYPVVASGSETSRPDILEDTFNIGLHLTLGTGTGIPGTAVGISGRGFGKGEKDITITYDGVTVASGVVADRLGTFSTTFIVPPSGAGQHVIKVSSATADNDLDSEIGFTVVPGIAVEITSGPPGTSVDVSGSGFTARSNEITISYDNTPVLTGVATDAEGGFRISFIIPPSPAGLHQITVSEPLTTSATSPQKGFRVIPTASLSDPFGHVGMNLDVIGQGFEPATTVTITYDNLKRAAIFTDPTGSFHLTFPIPESRGGEHSVNAYDERGNKIQLPFLVESQPPLAPSLLSPINGESGGWFGGFRPTPSWSNVDDPSGVTYTLEMATDPHFLNPILIQENLSSPAYLLTEDQGLPRGNYYWRVKATDLADNEGPWSPVFVVQSGIVPIWMLPALGVLVVLGSGGGAYTFIYRRRLQARQGTMLPELIRITKPGPMASLPMPSGPLALGQGPLLALPSPAQTGGPLVKKEAKPASAKTPSLESQTQIRLVKDFVGSIPVLQVSHDLVWLEQLIEAMDKPMDNPARDIYEWVLEDQINVSYRPPWSQHPAYQVLLEVDSARPLVESLDAYTESVNSCAVEAMELVWRIHASLTTAYPVDNLQVRQWRFVHSIAQSAVGWSRGLYLEHPTVRDYYFEEEAAPSGERILSLVGGDNTAFPGVILTELNEVEALFYREVHVDLRRASAQDERVQLLATRLALTDGQRRQVVALITKLNGKR